jgi:hypothetical protein
MTKIHAENKPEHDAAAKDLPKVLTNRIGVLGIPQTESEQAIAEKPEQITEEQAKEHLENLCPDIIPACFIVTTLGYWARGNSIKQAAIGCQKNGARAKDTATAWLVMNDPTAEVNECGYIIREYKSSLVKIGTTTISHLKRL